MTGEDKGGGGVGAKSYDRKKAWCSINHSILQPPSAAHKQSHILIFQKREGGGGQALGPEGEQRLKERRKAV